MTGEVLASTMVAPVLTMTGTSVYRATRTKYSVISLSWCSGMYEICQRSERWCLVEDPVLNVGDDDPETTPHSINHPSTSVSLGVEGTLECFRAICNDLSGRKGGYLVPFRPAGVH